jgi:4'-phosphopantetheinyl transferase EntD
MYTVNSALADRIRSLMPPGVMFAGGEIDAGQQPLYPEEEEAVRRAVPKRRAEFRAGRTYARAALLELGVAAVPIPAGADRAPVWPPEIAASITHDDTYCGVIAARVRDFAAVGIDIESAAPLDMDLVKYVCGAAELQHRTALGGQLAADFPKLIFCAKESAYKAYFSLTRTVLEFADVDVRVSPEDGAFSAAVRASAPAMPGFGREIAGSFLVLGGRLVTWATVPQTALRRSTA